MEKRQGRTLPSAVMRRREQRLQKERVTGAMTPMEAFGAWCG